MEELPSCRRASWADADRWADTLADRIRSADRLPEAIVGLTRGGWVPARLIADRLGVRKLIALGARHWGVTATRDGTAQIDGELSGPVEGKNVLVLDDITDTGESLALARAHVAEHGPARLETASFLHIAHSKFVPDYYAEEIPRDRWVWVVFPWNFWEDLRTLAGRAATHDARPASVRRILREKCGLEVPLAEVERALRENEAPGPRR